MKTPFAPPRICLHLHRPSRRNVQLVVEELEPRDPMSGLTGPANLASHFATPTIAPPSSPTPLPAQAQVQVLEVRTLDAAFAGTTQGFLGSPIVPIVPNTISVQNPVFSPVPGSAPSLGITAPPIGVRQESGSSAPSDLPTIEAPPQSVPPPEEDVFDQQKTIVDFARVGPAEFNVTPQLDAYFEATPWHEEGSAAGVSATPGRVPAIEPQKLAEAAAVLALLFSSRGSSGVEEGRCRKRRCWFWNGSNG